MGKYFGTDGIRGVVNQELDGVLAFKVGQAAAMVLSECTHKKPVIAIGKDTRISSDMLEAALTAGICSAGADVMPLGVIPTPAVAYITVKAGVDAGIVISASHNPFEHNGIKIFNSNGFKLSDELEAAIEELIDTDEKLAKKTGAEIGHVINDNNMWISMYIEYLSEQGKGKIKNCKVLIDCANGAASATATKVFSHFPIDFELIHDHPNGTNINSKCGSTHTEVLQQMVACGDFDMGIAFDGDADRCLVVDENGQLIDGDKIMAVCGCAMKAEGLLKGNAIVATVMSNMGFRSFTKEKGIELHCASVGDRNVLEMMQANGFNLGGEQSGHLIFLDDATTGDGQLAAVKFLGIVSNSGKKVSELVSEIPQYPQILINVPIKGGNSAKDSIMRSDKLHHSIQQEEARLGNDGRILVRPSGTEALIRVMVEAKSAEAAEETSKKLVNLIKTL